jgi:hypothetical protein
VIDAVGVAVVDTIVVVHVLMLLVLPLLTLLLLSCLFRQSYLTGGCWSPTRAGVFFTTRMDGVVDIWDYYHRQNAVAYSHKVHYSVASDATACVLSTDVCLLCMYVLASFSCNHCRVLLPVTAAGYCYFCCLLLPASAVSYCFVLLLFPTASCYCFLLLLLVTASC